MEFLSELLAFIAGGGATFAGLKYVPPLLKKKATKKKRSAAAKARYAKKDAPKPTGDAS